MFKFNFKKKLKKREELLLNEYENGKILQVDNGIDNKKYLKEMEDNLNESNKPTEEQNN